MRGRLLGIVSGLCCAALLLLCGSASAVSFDLGAAAGYAGLGLDGVPITISSGNTVINGSIGVGPNGSLDFSGGGQILNGHIDKDPTSGAVNITGGSTVAGGVHTINMNPAVHDALAAAAAAAALSPTQTVASITNGNSTFSGNGGTNVVSVTGDINLSGGATFAINGTAKDEFIFNVAGAMTLSGGSKIVLSGGITPDRVMFNFTGSGKAVNLNGNSDTVGVFLDPLGDITVSGGVHNSSFISGTQLKFQSGPNITAVPAPAPLIGTVALLAGLGALIHFRRRASIV